MEYSAPSPMVDTFTASRILNIAETTLRRWRSQGKGPSFVKIENQVRYKVDDLNKYIADHTH